ncbi:MAG: hypothetical protein HZA90_20350 [Verrucomicrobia bacterium]|nr:hypothetical protein [Verrucomicrobiota bacterium]
MKQVLALRLTAALLALASSTLGADAPPPATLDPSFATNCQALGPGSISTLALQPDGTILVGGWFTSVGGVLRTNVARLNSDGSVDASFAVGPQYPSQPVDCLALQADGRLWIAGGFTNIADRICRRLARLEADGNVDVTIADGSGASSNVKALALQTNGQLVLAGYFGGIYSGNTGTIRPRVARLNLNGTLDSSFDAGTNTDNSLEAVIVQPDQKILIAGAFKSPLGVVRPPIVRLNSDGTPAAGFAPVAALGSRFSRMARQADGRILIAGTFTNLNATPVTNFARLNADGSLDTAFASRLRAADDIRAMALQADGKILIGGNIQSVNSVPCGNLARLHPDGQVDTNFNFVSMSTVTALAIQPDGRILVASGNRLLRLLGDGGGGPVILTSPQNVTVEPGAAVAFSVRAAGEALHYQWEKDSVPLAGQTNITLSLHSLQPGDAGSYRVTVSNPLGTAQSAAATLQIVSTQPLSTAGMVDPSFNPGTGTDDSVYALALQSDGRILLGGWFTNYNNTACTNLIRVLPNGSRDSGFTPNLGRYGSVVALAIQPDGKIVVVGSFTNVGGVLCNGIARFNTNGALDATFNSGTGADGDIKAVALQPNGQVLIGGAFTSVNGVARTNVARLNANGSVDAAFHPVPDDEVRGLAVQPDGKILLGGRFWNIGPTFRPHIARLDSSGNVDAGFNAGSVQGGVFIPYVSTIKVLTNGQLLIAGNFSEVGGVTRNWLARLNANGGVDTNFNAALGSSAQVSAVAVQPDGKLLVGGYFIGIGGLSRNNIARLNPDGSGDASFDPGAGPSSQVYALALQPDGRTLLAGGFTEVDGVARRHVARLLADRSAPVIVTGPASRTAAVGDTVGFTVQAVGFAPLIYRWQKGTVPIAGATNATLIRSNLTTTDAGSYSVVVSNSLGTATSGAATLTVLDLPQITEQPQGRCYSAGASATLRVTALASSPMSYQWHRDRGWSGGPISGATNAAFTLANLQASDEGRYWVVVSCTHGAVTSAVAELRIPRAGGLDPTFNPGAGVFGDVLALALQPDGRIVAGGQFTSVNDTPRANLARLLPDGRLDSSFGLECGADQPVESVAVQAGGAVLVGGLFTSVHGVGRPHLARINPDNCVEAGFNPLLDGTVKALAVQAGDKILAGGLFYSVNGNYAKAGLARFTADGGIDSDFLGSWAWKVKCLALAPDGGFAAGGTEGQVVRRDSTGYAWPGFAAPTIQGGWINAIAFQSDGRILIGGVFTNVGGVAITNLARLNTNGTVDASFPRRLRTGQDVFCLAVQTDGRILVGGRFNSIGGVSRGNIARLEANGSVDLDYAATANDWVCAIVLQPDGHAVIGGYFTEVNDQPRGGIARLLATDSAPLLLVQPAVVGTNFTFAFLTQTNQTYTVEYSDDLGTTNWLLHHTLTGNGSLLPCLIPMTNAAQRFFRVRMP